MRSLHVLHQNNWAFELSKNGYYSNPTPTSPNFSLFFLVRFKVFECCLHPPSQGYLIGNWVNQPSINDKTDSLFSVNFSWNGFSINYWMFVCLEIHTPWKFNSLPLKISHPKMKVIFQPSFFRGYVKLPGVF